MMNLIRKFVSGLAVGFGISIAVLMTTFGYSATLSLLTGPQPAADLVSIVNTLITNINATLAPAGTGTMSSALGIWGGTSTATGTGMIQFLGSNFWITATASNCKTGASSSLCLEVIDPTGTIRYIQAF